MDSKPFALLGIDVGTTHCKAGLFVQDGPVLRSVHLASRPTGAEHHPDGFAYYDPDALWQTVAAAAREAAAASGVVPLAAVGVASMAETGLLVDLDSAQARSPILPWFDTGASAQASRMVPPEDLELVQERFTRSGIYPSFKCSLAKLLWLRERQGDLPEKAIWLSAADYIVFRLTGQVGTDYSLAGRTYAFDPTTLSWDAGWLRSFDLTPSMFPPAVLSGTPVGRTVPANQAGLPAGVPVAVAGHDHVCAAYALGAARPGQVFDSIGTAETLIGAIPARRLGQAEYNSGFNYGHHVVAGAFYWMGGLSYSGGSLVWLRGVLGDPPLAYGEVERLLAEAGAGPTGILFLPYLAGSGAPHSDQHARAAFLGLTAGHTRADLLKAVLEGTAFEIELIRRAAGSLTGQPVKQVVAAGGGARNPVWMQIKADVSGCLFSVPDMTEATLLGAALRAAVGSGLYASDEAALAAASPGTAAVYLPDSDRHARYRSIFEQGYLALQEPARAYARLAGAFTDGF